MASESPLPPKKYFQQYRKLLGFNSEASAKVFLSAKNISPSVDMAYVKLLNSRIADIINKLNPVIHQSVAISNLDDFLISHLHGPVDQIQKMTYFRC